MHQFTMDDSVQAWSLYAVRLNSLIQMLLGRRLPIPLVGFTNLTHIGGTICLSFFAKEVLFFYFSKKHNKEVTA